MSSRVTIAQANPSICQQVRRFEQRVWGESDIVSPYDAMYYIRYGYAFVAKDQGKMVGVIIAMRTRNNEIKIIDWVVKKTHRRQGIGNRLFRRLIRAVGNTPVISIISCTNTASLTAHERLGFVRQRKIDDPYCLGEKKRYWILKKG